MHGIAKGRLWRRHFILSVPMMALVMLPTQAAAVLLPILVV